MLYPRTIDHVNVPPVKTQGIKTKLVKFIAESIQWEGKGRWIEPFLGSGVVLFNLAPQKAIASDSNKHIINFYTGIQSGKITADSVKEFLELEGDRLLTKGESYFYEVRKRFNEQGDPMDLLFLNRSCFNGVMRFNGKGGYNVPFCRKPNRFARSYVTKITNQVRWLSDLLKKKDWKIQSTDWRNITSQCKENDFLYLDPPYAGRHTDYYNTWKDSDLHDLATALEDIPCGFALSLWHGNKYRTNESISKYFSKYHVETFTHFYHVGSFEDLRSAMTEALIIKPGFLAVEQKISVIRKS